jgi:hypothetical protein
MSQDYGWIPDMSDEGNLSFMLGLCGCGDPRAVMELFRRSLRRMNPNREKGDCKEELFENFGIHNALDSDLVWAHLYQLDSLGLIEHGGAALTGWLTDKGHFVLEKLEAFFSSQEPKP